MPTKKPTAADLLTLIAARAEDLRRAGVLSVHLEGIGSWQLAPYEPPAEKSTAATDDGPHIDPLQDPATYQRGVVPGFARDPLDEPID